MLIHANEKFISDNATYEVVTDLDRSQGITTYTTYLYDENGEKPIADTGNSQDFPYFYRLGWTKKECQSDLKGSWTIVKERGEHLEDLASCIKDYNIKNWLNLDVWENLPTEDAFIDWLEDDFKPLWNELEEQDGERDFDEDNARLVESVERLDALMEANPELVQLVD